MGAKNVDKLEEFCSTEQRIKSSVKNRKNATTQSSKSKSSSNLKYSAQFCKSFLVFCFLYLQCSQIHFSDATSFTLFPSRIPPAGLRYGAQRVPTYISFVSRRQAPAYEQTGTGTGTEIKTGGLFPVDSDQKESSNTTAIFSQRRPQYQLVLNGRQNATSFAPAFSAFAPFRTFFSSLLNSYRNGNTSSNRNSNSNSKSNVPNSASFFPLFLRGQRQKLNENENEKQVQNNEIQTDRTAKTTAATLDSSTTSMPSSQSTSQSISIPTSTSNPNPNAKVDVDEMTVIPIDLDQNHNDTFQLNDAFFMSHENNKSQTTQEEDEANSQVSIVPFSVNDNLDENASRKNMMTMNLDKNYTVNFNSSLKSNQNVSKDQSEQTVISDRNVIMNFVRPVRQNAEDEEDELADTPPLPQVEKQDSGSGSRETGSEFDSLQSELIRNSQKQQSSSSSTTQKTTQKTTSRPTEESIVIFRDPDTDSETAKGKTLHMSLRSASPAPLVGAQPVETENKEQQLEQLSSPMARMLPPPEPIQNYSLEDIEVESEEDDDAFDLADLPPIPSDDDFGADNGIIPSLPPLVQKPKPSTVTTAKPRTTATSTSATERPRPSTTSTTTTTPKPKPTTTTTASTTRRTTTTSTTQRPRTTTVQTTPKTTSTTRVSDKNLIVMGDLPPLPGQDDIDDDSDPFEQLPEAVRGKISPKQNPQSTTFKTTVTTPRTSTTTPRTTKRTTTRTTTPQTTTTTTRRTTTTTEPPTTTTRRTTTTTTPRTTVKTTPAQSEEEEDIGLGPVPAVENDAEVDSNSVVNLQTPQTTTTRTTSTTPFVPQTTTTPQAPSILQIKATTASVPRDNFDNLPVLTTSSPILTRFPNQNPNLNSNANFQNGENNNQNIFSEEPKNNNNIRNLDQVPQNNNNNNASPSVPINDLLGIREYLQSLVSSIYSVRAPALLNSGNSGSSGILNSNPSQTPHHFNIHIGTINLNTGGGSHSIYNGNGQGFNPSSPLQSNNNNNNYPNQRPDLAPSSPTDGVRAFMVQGANDRFQPGKSQGQGQGQGQFIGINSQATTSRSIAARPPSFTFTSVSKIKQPVIPSSQSSDLPPIIQPEDSEDIGSPESGGNNFGGPPLPGVIPNNNGPPRQTGSGPPLPIAPPIDGEGEEFDDLPPSPGISGFSESFDDVGDRRSKPTKNRAGASEKSPKVNQDKPPLPIAQSEYDEDEFQIDTRTSALKSKLRKG